MKIDAHARASINCMRIMCCVAVVFFFIEFTTLIYFLFNCLCPMAILLFDDFQISSYLFWRLSKSNHIWRYHVWFPYHVCLPRVSSTPERKNTYKLKANNKVNKHTAYNFILIYTYCNALVYAKFLLRCACFLIHNFPFPIWCQN